jgi:GNAT superfamily N-acetyltransferase
VAALRVLPADEVPWDDVATVFGAQGDTSRCWCQRYSYTDGWIWHGAPEMHRESLQAQVEERGAGLVGYLDDEPVGWCALGPRPSYLRLLKMPVPWKGRAEDRQDDGVWAVTCFVVRVGFRKRGISGELALAAVEHARASGARALEAYPMLTQEGKDITWGELHVGARSVFAAAGMTQVSHPFPRRVVMRIELDEQGSRG